MVEHPTDMYTLGIEEEFQLVDPDTGELVARAGEVLEGTTGDQLQSELFQSVVETATPICLTLDQAREEVARLRGQLIDLAGDHGLAVAAAGTHPSADYEDQAKTPSDRYDKLRRRVRWPFERSLVFGQHVHIGVASAAEAVAAMNTLRALVPVLLGLSVNAPFWRGRDTGLASVRLRIFDAMPRSGLQPRFEDWRALATTVETLKQAGAIEDLSKVWWDIRPRPSLGTIEVRVCDALPEADRSVALAGLIQAIVARAVRGAATGEPLDLVHLDEVVAENRWRAMRDGTRARLVHPDGEGGVELLAVPEVLELLQVELEPEIEQLGLKRSMDTLSRMASRHDMGAERQRAIHAKSGELAAVVRDLVERTVP